MTKGLALIFAIIYLIFLAWIALDCDEKKEYVLKYITLGLAGIVPMVMCVIISL